LARHTIADAARGEEIRRSLFQDTGSDAALDVVPAAPLENDGCNALPVEEMREHEPGRTRADDADHPTLQNVSNARLALKRRSRGPTGPERGREFASRGSSHCEGARRRRPRG